VTDGQPGVATGPLPPPIITDGFLREKSDFLTLVQAWPLTAQLDYQAWLSNFEPDELDVARELVHGFCYLSESWIRHTFRSSFQALSLEVTASASSFAQRRALWRTFCDTVRFTFIEKENPSVTASGYAFVRNVKILLAIDDSRIFAPSELLDELVNSRPMPVVFVDDFAGSGTQAFFTWHQERELPSGLRTSFAQYCGATGCPMFFIPLICNHLAWQNLGLCPGLTVRPGHLLSERFSVFSENSLIWSPRTLGTAVETLRRASERAGIPDKNGDPGDWRGYGKQGLALAFAGAPPPDAVLPIFSWAEDEWKPLIRV
jgi:hypothetical protein